ncbi:HNH endonuclease [Bradyrhizobium australafricanum]|uniref:HNH endonuclease n=1 Tax=Bradyrhizobium australafricanum TaxID=2821406 RepID=UPI0028998CA0|nr:HNH endonuclease [Bradyrhizobium australafricanum]
MQQEVVEPAKVADHIKPHRGNAELFFDPNNLQSLCAACHDSTKQRIELGQVGFGSDGWPLEPGV